MSIDVVVEKDPQRGPADGSPPPARPGMQSQRPPVLTVSDGWGAVLRAAARRWPLLLLLGGLPACAAAALVWRYLPQPKLAASVVLEISPQAPTIVTAAAPADDRELHSFQLMQANLIKHRRVFVAALKHAEMQSSPFAQSLPDPVAWLETNVKVDLKLGNEFLKVSVDGDDSQWLRVVLTAVTEAYLAEIVDKERGRRLVRLQKLKSLSNLYLRRLDEKIGALAAIGRSSEGSLSSLRQQIAQKNLGQALHEITLMHSEVRRWLTEACGDEPAAAQKTPEVLVAAEMDADPSIRKERERIQILESALEGYRQAAAPGVVTHRMNQLESELQVATRNLASAGEKARASAVQRLHDRRVRESLLAARTSGERAVKANALERKLGEEIESLARNAAKAGVGDRDAEQIKREKAQIERMTESLFVGIETLEMEKDAPPRVAVFQDVLVAPKGEGTRRYRFTASAWLLAFFLGAFPIVRSDLHRRPIASAFEISEGLGLRLLGTIPHVAGRRRGYGWSGGRVSLQQTAMLNESIDATRTVMMHTLERREARSVMVASAIAGEGKTSFASDVARSFARAGRRTILVDADMRQPSVHRIMEFENKPGLSEHLRGEAEIDECLRPTSFPGLVVFAAGDWTPETSAALAGDGWRNLLDRLEGEFDVVVVDTPPVLLVTDALVLGQHVDATILSVLRGVSQLDLLHKAQGRLNDVGVSTLGVVMSGESGQSYGSSYYRRNGQGRC